MKELKFNKELAAYACAFVSFVLPKIEVKEIILFGSAARGEADKNSDIDLFFDVEVFDKPRTSVRGTFRAQENCSKILQFSAQRNPKSCKISLASKSPEQTSAFKQRYTQGLFDVDVDENKIKNIIKEELNKFYKSKIAESWFLRGIKNEIKFNVGRISEWKLYRSIISEGITLYGKYKEIPKDMQPFVFFQIEAIKDIAKRNKVIRKLFGRKEKNYLVKGLIDEFKGKKYSSSSFILGKEYADKAMKLLMKEKVSYRFFEFWSDR